MKRFLYMLTWTIVISFIIFMGTKYQVLLQQEGSEKFDLRPMVLFSYAFYFVIGFLLRLPKLIIEIIEGWSWTFDWVKFIAIGLLPILISIYFFLLMFFSWNLLPSFSPIVFLGSPVIQIVSNIVVGYVFLDCLKKPSNDLEF